MKRILIIGIGAGNPDYVTIQAVNALNEVDVFFVMDKGVAKEKLIALRKDICRRFIKGSDYRFAEATSPERVRDVVNYRASVEDLNDDKQAVFERLISEEMSDGECGAFLTWGDPALYDSTIRIIDAIIKKGGHDLVYEVIPGISSIQALAAQHKIPLTRIGESIEITTGRRIAEGFPDNVDSVVVMLDAEGAYKRFVDQDIDIYWGAYIGTPDEILVSGKLKDVAGEIDRLRTEARKANGWIMDSYLMRRNRSRGDN
ncbi:precorrin 6A synthase [Caballeronia udeis]|uniref:Precorrin 6A synthase n=1 Tax=Caballeronia udeis TaxID=1232866 RepID=A0A158H3X2_9BURK|nr:precorrin-6A synthase (deacetylating) [Caballeronia udeis]SAL39028.1 precorrin 6A synthase [Caballeronia udeis]